VIAGCALCAGCSSVSSTAKRAGILGAGAALGGAAGYAAGDKDATKAVLGAVAGATVTALAMGEDRDARQAGFDQGYVHGQSDAIKRQYFLRHAMEAQPPAPPAGSGETVYYVMPGPEVTADGRKLEPHSVAVRVVE
jgi:hypothetical protein